MTRKLAFLLLITILLNPACGDSNGPGRGDPIPDGVAIFDEYPVWSEVHDLIAYAHLKPPDSTGADTLGIYVIKPDGSERRMIYQYGDIFVSGLDWSKDGNWLVTNAGRMIVIIAFTTGQADTLTSPGDFWDPAFSHDGNSIAFVKKEGEGRGIYIRSIDGSHTRPVIPYGHFVNWPYPDSLVYLNFDSLLLPIGAICIADTTGNFKRVLYQPGENIIYATPTPKMHAVSGRLVYYGQEVGILAGSIWAIEAGSDSVRRLRSFAIHPCFSPDGNKIVFTDIHKENGNLWLINWEGGGLIQLTD